MDKEVWLRFFWRLIYFKWLMKKYNKNRFVLNAVYLDVFRGDFPLMKKLKTIIMQRETNMLLSVWKILKFLKIPLYVFSSNMFIFLIHMGGSVWFLLRILCCLGRRVRIVDSTLAYLLLLVFLHRMDMCLVSGFVGFLCSINVLG